MYLKSMDSVIHKLLRYTKPNKVRSYKIVKISLFT